MKYARVPKFCEEASKKHNSLIVNKNEEVSTVCVLRIAEQLRRPSAFTEFSAVLEKIFSGTNPTSFYVVKIKRPGSERLFFKSGLFSFHHVGTREYFLQNGRKFVER
jgi:hypothetical protein